MFLQYVQLIRQAFVLSQVLSCDSEQWFSQRDSFSISIAKFSPAVLALYAARQTSGIVVNIGFQVITIVPILNGKVMRQVGVEVIGFGAFKLTGFLTEKMQENNTTFQSLYTVRTLKENLYYVALDYEAELSRDTKASVEIMGEGWFTLSNERFQTGEIIFQPRLAGM
ncbi:hypothetical protein YC2023_118303 [Brassica napus]